MVFLDTNGATIGGTPEDWYQLTMGVATSVIKKPELTRQMAAFVQRG